MKVIVSGIDLNDAVNKVIKAASPKSPQPALEGIKLVSEGENLILSATDLELFIEVKIKADVALEGVCLVPGKLFSEYVRKLTDEEITLSLDGQKLNILYGESKGMVACLNVSDFPTVRKIDNADNFVTTEKNLKTLIEKSVIAASTDDSRPIFKGCLFEVGTGGEKFVKSIALDGFKLALIKKDVISFSREFKVIVPARSLNEIAKLLSDSNNEITVLVQHNYLMVEIGSIVVQTRLFDGEFINYKTIIREIMSGKVTINKHSFEVALERAALLSRIERNNIVKFDINERTLSVSTNSEAGEVDEKILITSNIHELAIAFNAKYILDVLKVIPDEFVKITFENKTDPCIITNDKNDEYLFLVLPVRLM